MKRTYADLALQLVDQVHHVLGRYRADDTRTGWISGLGEREGESHPTCGGLRIGKALPERRRVAQLMARGAFEDGILLKSLLAMAQEGLVHYAQHGDWRQPASRRLALGELGLAAVERLQKDMDDAAGAPSTATNCTRGCALWARTSGSVPRSCRRGWIPSINECAHGRIIATSTK